MSDNWLILIPTDPSFEPAPGAASKAVAFLEAELPAADEVKAESTPEIRFIDCGANLETIQCPHTGKTIPMEKWGEIMSTAAEGDFVDLGFICPCCGKQSSLDKLLYHFPQGFAKFSLEAMNPNVPSLTDAQIGEVERILGCRLTVIWQHI
jgi:hypothetical protein